MVIRPMQPITTPVMISPYFSNQFNFSFARPSEPRNVSPRIGTRVDIAKIEMVRTVTPVPKVEAANAIGSNAMQGVRPIIITKAYGDFAS